MQTTNAQRLLGLLGSSIVLVACDAGPAAVDGSSRSATAASAPRCERDCLIGFIDRYLDAVVAHDAARLPLASTVKYTENAQRLELNDGLWGTASSGAKYRLDFADADAGQVGVFALIEESEQPSLIGTRLKVANGLIEEIETVVVRGGEALSNSPVLAAPRPAFDEIEEPARRSSRTGLFAIADRYFEALEKNLAGYVPFDDSCQRIENGIQTTGNTEREPFPTLEFNVRAMGCKGNVDSQAWTYITKISPRRFLIADPERGIAFGIVMFHHNGTIESFTVPGVGTFENTGARRRPFTTVIPELFKIRDGQIVAIEAVMASLPYGAKSGWD